MAPKNLEELKDMLRFAVTCKGPVVIRYPKGGVEKIFNLELKKHIELGKAEILKFGKDVSILAIGKMVERAMYVAKKLKEKSIEADVINVRFLKPIDEKTIYTSIKKSKLIVTIEDGTIINGLSSAVKEIMIKNNLDKIRLLSFAYPDEFIKQGSIEELEKLYGMDKESIIQKIEKEISKK